jgi:plastocyanin
MKLLLLFAACLLGLEPLGAGTISGTIRAQGKPGLEDEGGGGGSYSSKKLKFAERIDYNDIRPFVVYIEGPIAGTKPLVMTNEVRQKDATFIPHVLPIMVGTTVEWPNDDPIFHNVYSKSSAMRFDLDLYKKGDRAKEVTFTKPGEVDVFCSIHARMSCIILVLENPFFAVSDARGRYAITNVPPGQYTLVAWQERLPEDSRIITVPENGDLAGVNFVLGPKNLPKY